MYSASEEFDVGGDGSEISSAYFDSDGNFSGGDVVIPKGYSSIIEYLKNELDIRLNQVVSSVNRVGNGFNVITNNSTYLADVVICALPLGVLKSGKISFTPDISEKKRNAIQKIGVGAVNKIILEYPTSFWDESKQYINYFVTHWNSDPYSLGSYSFHKVGSEPSDYEELSRVEPPNLFFCGEHTNEAYRGTVHGAYLSGIRVADEVKNSVF